MAEIRASAADRAQGQPEATAAWPLGRRPLASRRGVAGCRDFARSVVHSPLYSQSR